MDLLPFLRGWSVNNQDINMSLTSVATVNLFEVSGVGALVYYAIGVTIPSSANLFGSLITLVTDNSTFNKFPLVFNGQEASSAGPFTSVYSTGSTTSTIYVFFNPSYWVPFRNSLTIQFTPPAVGSGGVVNVVGSVSYVSFDVPTIEASVGRLLSGVLSNFKCG